MFGQNLNWMSSSWPNKLRYRVIKSANQLKTLGYIGQLEHVLDLFLWHFHHLTISLLLNAWHASLTAYCIEFKILILVLWCQLGMSLVVAWTQLWSGRRNLHSSVGVNVLLLLHAPWQCSIVLFWWLGQIPIGSACCLSYNSPSNSYEHLKTVFPLGLGWDCPKLLSWRCTI